MSFRNFFGNKSRDKLNQEVLKEDPKPDRSNVFKTLVKWADVSMEARNERAKQLAFESLAAYRQRFRRAEELVEIRTLTKLRRAVQCWPKVIRRNHVRARQVKTISRSFNVKLAPKLKMILVAWQNIRKEYKVAVDSNTANVRVISMTVVQIVRKEVRTKAACWRAWRLTVRRAKLCVLAQRKAMLYLSRGNEALQDFVFHLWAELPREGAVPRWDVVLPKLLGLHSQRSKKSLKQAVMFAWLDLLVVARHTQQLKRKAVMKMMASDCEGRMLVMVFRSWAAVSSSTRIEAEQTKMAAKVAESEEHLTNERGKLATLLAAKEREVEAEQEKMALQKAQERETLASAKAEHTAALNAERAKMEADLAAEREQMASDHKVNLEAERDKMALDHNARLEAERDKMAAKIAESEETIANERGKMASHLAAKQGDVEAELQKMTRQTAQERETLASEKAEHNAALTAERANMESKLAAERDKMASDHKAKLEAERDKMAAKIAENEDSLVIEREKMASYHKAKLEAERDKMAAKIAENEESLVSEREKMASDHKAKLEAELDKMGAKLAETKESFINEQSNMTAQLAAKQNEIETELQKMALHTAQERETLASEKAEHNVALNAERAQMACDLAAEREKMAADHNAKFEAERDTMIRQAAEIQEKMTSEHKAMLEAERLKHSSLLAEQKTQFEAERKKIALQAADERKKLASELAEHRAEIEAEREKMAAEAAQEKEKMASKHAASLKAEREKMAEEAAEKHAIMAAEHEDQKATLHANHEDIVSQMAKQMAGEVAQHQATLKDEKREIVAQYQRHRTMAARDRRRGAVMLSVHALLDSKYGVSEEMCDGDLRLVLRAWKVVGRRQRDKKVQVLQKLVDDSATSMRLTLTCILSTWGRQAQNCRHRFEVMNTKADGVLRLVFGLNAHVTFGAWCESVKETQKQRAEEVTRMLREEHRRLQHEVNMRTVYAKIAVLTLTCCSVHLQAWSGLVRRRRQAGHPRSLYLKNVALMTIGCLSVCVHEWKAVMQQGRHQGFRVVSLSMKLALMGTTSLRIYLHEWKASMTKLHHVNHISRVGAVLLASSMAGALKENTLPVEILLQAWAQLAHRIAVAKRSALLFANHMSSNRRGLLMRSWRDTVRSQRRSREHKDARKTYIMNLIQALFRRSCSEDAQLFRSMFLRWAVGSLQPKAEALKTNMYRVSRLKSHVRNAVSMAIDHESQGCVEFVVTVWRMIAVMQKQVDNEMDRLVDQARRQKCDTAHGTVMLHLREVDEGLIKICTRSWRSVAWSSKRHQKRGYLAILGSAIACKATAFDAWRRWILASERHLDKLKKEALAWHAFAQKAATAYNAGRSVKDEDEESEVLEISMGDSCDEGAVGGRTPGSTPKSRQPDIATPTRRSPFGGGRVSSLPGTPQPQGLRSKGRGRGGMLSSSQQLTSPFRPLR